MITRRALMIGGAAATALAPMMPALAAAPGYRIAPHEVADGIWLIEGAQESFGRANGGAICNIIMLETPEGAIVVDTGGTARHGAALRAFADQRLGGVAVTLNTHHHPDHWFGNQAFADRPLRALAETSARQTDSAQVLADGLYRILGSWMNGTTPAPAGLPVEGDAMAIGGRDLQLLALSGHSQADLALLDRRTGTLIAGDLLFYDRAPSFPDADLAAWHTALQTLAAIGASGIIPGHGPFARDNRAIAQTNAYLRDFQARLASAADQGLSPAEALAAGPMPEFGEMGANPEEYRRAVIQRWRDFEDQALPLISGRT